MFDARLAPLQRRLLQPLAQHLHAQGVRADTLTLAGFALGLLAVGAAAAGLPLLALAGLLANRLADGLDGAVARLAGPTDRGAFLDIALDFLFYALFPLGFALADPAANALPAAVLIASFIGTGSSFLAFSLIADRRGLKAADYPSKGIYYLGGLTEGAETIALFVAFCLFPQAFAPLALIFAAACTFTTALRLLAGWRMFG
ncbi:CDP-alcohol phosphatidyltransferase family protein [Salipiger marinus]|uniref:CDP-alcohol phosphatidyltransferase family protein n=1 Tax=Salipiger marinus TaxID=555512 RepID=UPI001E5C770B|nr:CDP-alcohol phosphatidyltransferase family protein [Salipiger manganoxidans]MCD1618356.1 CDP-alcohol phosphatidyltransferase family protein [Salipiger manganoxidans]MEB3418047.1 CDP-alcohol phosphatidyltransferase family protein [Salipiger manganoxidans]